MKKHFFILFIFIATLSFGQAPGNALVSGERHQIKSTYLEEDRTFQIYLPPTYYFSDKSTFPVVYLMDGDYNFHYDTGLIEFLSNVSGRIPEMIVVGISDRGNAKYRVNCTPTNTSKQSGNASNFMSFIEKELKPHINKNYRTADYDIIIGHSLGGLFTTNYMLERPQDFDSYIAIDPSLWWGDYEISERADSIFKGQEDMAANLYISLADTKQMGVHQFVGILDKHFPTSTKWNFEHYEDENHGSVGLITIKDALESIFEGWEISRPQFYAFKGAIDVSNHYKDFSKRFSCSFVIPSSSLANVVYYYHRKKLPKELDVLEAEIKQHFPSSLDDFYMQVARNHMDDKALDKAEEIYIKRIEEDPNSFHSYNGLSKIFFERKAFQKAKDMSDKSIAIAKRVKVRQWQLNELVSTNDKIKAQFRPKAVDK